MTSLDQFATRRVEAFEEKQQRRVLRPMQPRGVEVLVDGARLVNFASNDYLGLASDARLRTPVDMAGAGAARLVTGNHEAYAPLEAALAAYRNKQAALVFGSGYLANVGVIPALVEKGDLLLMDKLAHASMIDGAQLSGAASKRFRHNDLAHLEALLKEHRAQHRHALIATEHIFSMDGDRAPVEDLAALAKRYDAWLMVDDAHGMGFFEEHPPVDVWLGTLSKALGSYGGYVAGSRALIDYLATSARSFIFTTALPPAVCAAATAALGIMQAEPERAARARGYAQQVAEALGLEQPAAAIVPVVIGGEAEALAESARLRALGLLVTAIRPPTVPAGTARLRLAFSANHTPAQVQQLIDALKPARMRA